MPARPPPPRKKKAGGPPPAPKFKMPKGPAPKGPPGPGAVKKTPVKKKAGPKKKAVKKKAAGAKKTTPAKKVAKKKKTPAKKKKAPKVVKKKTPVVKKKPPVVKKKPPVVKKKPPPAKKAPLAKRAPPPKKKFAPAPKTEAVHLEVESDLPSRRPPSKSFARAVRAMSTAGTGKRECSIEELTKCSCENARLYSSLICLLFFFCLVFFKLTVYTCTEDATAPPRDIVTLDSWAIPGGTPRAGILITGLFVGIVGLLDKWFRKIGHPNYIIGASCSIVAIYLFWTLIQFSNMDNAGVTVDDVEYDLANYTCVQEGAGIATIIFAMFYFMAMIDCCSMLDGECLDQPAYDPRKIPAAYPQR